jgi:diguanylate cyclase (GGDEF)-like protein
VPLDGPEGRALLTAPASGRGGVPGRPPGEPDRPDGPAAALMAEALALVITPYDHLDGLLERADALARQAGERGLTRIAALGRLARADVRNRGQHVVEGVEITREVLDWATGAGDNLVTARAHALLSTGLYRLGAWTESVPHAAEAVALLDADAPLAIQADHALILAMLTNSMRNGGVSYSLFARADTLARQLGDPIMIVANLNNLAWLQYECREFADAAATVAELRAVAAGSGHELNASVLDTVAAVLLETGAADEAGRLITQALSGRVRVTDADSLAAVLLTHTEIRLRAGDTAAALEAATRCAELTRYKPLSDCAGAALHKVARIRATLGEYREAYEAMVAYHEEWERLRTEQGEAMASVLQTLFDVEQTRRDSERYQELAERDALTGLWNRRYLERRLGTLFEDAAAFGVGLVDLDHFKNVNDTFSHDTGDEVLRRTARLLERPGDGFAARLGGEEFIVVLPGADAVGACEALRQAIAGYPWAELAAGLAVTVSIGATAAVPGDTMSSLLRRADEHLYASKHAGRDRVTGDPEHRSPAPR